MNENLLEEEAKLAAARQFVYHFILQALEAPTLEQFAWVISAEFRSVLEALGDQFDVECPPGEPFPEEYSDFESRYLACFEVGLPQAPVPLIASHYNKREPVPATIHEHVLFYRRFQAAFADSDPGAADHLRYELAFLIHLDELLKQEILPAEWLLHARRDFLSRQVSRWVSQAAASAHDNHLPPVYQCLLDLLTRAVAQDVELLESAREPNLVSE